MRLKLLPGRFRAALNANRHPGLPDHEAEAEPRSSAARNASRLRFEDLFAGMSASYSHTITTQDVAAFSRLTGDMNPVHLDKAYARGTRFGDRIVHGLLTASYISTVLGTKLPGEGAIYISQTLNFRAPVYHGDTVTARVEVVELIEEKARAVMACTCHAGERLVVEGEAVLKVPRRGKE